jgi:hypothetical protein
VWTSGNRGWDSDFPHIAVTQAPLPGVFTMGG